MKVGSRFLSLLMSVVLAVGLVPGLAHAGAGNAPDDQSGGLVAGVIAAARATEHEAQAIINTQALETLSADGVGVKQVSLGGSHSAAVKTDGSLWTWGDNSYGQLGDGTTEDRTTPVEIQFGSDSGGSARGYSVATSTWGFKNFSERIPLDACKIMLGNSYDWEVYKSNAGTGGLCYGFPASAMAVSVDGFPSASSFRNGAGVTSGDLYGVGEDWTSPKLGLSAHAYVVMGWLAQKLPSVSRPKKWSKDNYEWIMGATREWLDGGEPVVIHVHGTRKNRKTSKPEGAGHALWPLRIEDGDGVTYVYVYDCNYPGEERVLTMYKDEGGAYTGWAYDVSSSLKWGTTRNDSRAAMYFSTPADDLERRLRSVGFSASAIAAQSTDDDASYKKLIRIESDAVATIDGREYALGRDFEYADDNLLLASDDGFLEDASGSEAALYWANFDDEVRFAGLEGSAEVGVAAESGGVDLTLSDAQEAAVSLDNASRARVSVSQEPGSDFSLEFFTDGGSDDLDRVSLSGETSGELGAQLVPDGMVVQGATSIVVADSDGESRFEGLDAGKSYTVVARDGDGAAPALDVDDGTHVPDSPTKPGASKTSISKATVGALKDKVYTGAALTQQPVVKLGSTTLREGTDYTVSYSNNVNAGTATVTVTGKGNYTDTAKASFTIAKAKNTLSAKAKSKTLKAKNLKKKKASVKKLVTVKKAKGKVTYKNASKAKKLKKFKVNSKNGAITVPKGTKKGTYKVKVKIAAKGDANYESGSKTVTVKVRVK